MAKNKINNLVEAKRVLEVEAKCILAAQNRLGQNISDAVELIVRTVRSGGKVVVIGVGKSGKIAAKVAATLASTGTPALYLHPTEASHGDLGVVAPKDVVLLFSYSGASDEIVNLLPSLRNKKTKIVSIVGNKKSAIAAASDVVLDGSVEQEACPLNLAPTSSTTVALALGDALAVVLSLHFDFKEEVFASNHPGGALGRRLTLLVRDLMKSGPSLPWVAETDNMEKVVNVSSEKKLGAVLVYSGPKNLKQCNWIGLITDGDIRRALKHKSKFFTLKAKDIMTENPISVQATDKAIRALELMENRTSQINVLPVTDQHENCIGLLRLHDLIGQL